MCLSLWLRNQPKTREFKDKGAQENINIRLFFFFLFLKLISVKSFQRTDVKTGGLEYQNSRLGGLYQSAVKILPTQSHFSAHPVCLMNTEVCLKSSP